jgi:hypothetical protein
MILLKSVEFINALVVAVVMTFKESVGFIVVVAPRTLAIAPIGAVKCTLLDQDKISTSREGCPA